MKVKINDTCMSHVRSIWPPRDVYFWQNLCTLFLILSCVVLLITAMGIFAVYNSIDEFRVHANFFFEILYNDPPFPGGRVE